MLVKSEGVNATERHLIKLCEKSFLSLWSYPNPHKSPSQELCDLLVVCNNDIIIFSDKDRSFPDTGNLLLDWQRWYRRSIAKSAEQIYTAESWIRRNPDKIFLDVKCHIALPYPLPNIANARIHRIAVTKNSKERCIRHFGNGSGSLIIAPYVKADDHLDPTKNPVIFAVGDIDPARGFIHVLDEVSLDILMSELDTVSDFVEYLIKREEFIRSGKLAAAAGEEELLGYYLCHIQNGEYGFYISKEHEGKVVFIEEGWWKEVTGFPEYASKKEADKISYIWDSIIEQLSSQAVEGHPALDTTIADAEEILRLMAAESRLGRRVLSDRIKESIFSASTQPGYRRVTAAFSQCSEGVAYIFSQFSHRNEFDYEYNLKARIGLLQSYCHVFRYRYPHAKKIIGIGCETIKSNPNAVYDFIYYAPEKWTSDDDATAQQMQNQLKIFHPSTVTEGTIFPSKFPTTIASTSNILLKVGRNAACPCGSGKKYKKCCLG